MNNREMLDKEKPYTSSREYLSDELRLLDLLIRLEILKRQNYGPKNQLNQFKGLVISEEEIIGLLSDLPDKAGQENCVNNYVFESKSLINSINNLQSEIRESRTQSQKLGIYLSLPKLSQFFHLSQFEELCLIIGLAPELDLKYEKLYAYLQDDVTRKKPSVDLAIKLSCSTTQEKLEARSVFEPDAPLVKYRLIQLTDSSSDKSSSSLARCIKVDDRIMNFLLELGQIDSRLESKARLISPQSKSGHLIPSEDVRVRIRSLIQSHFNSANPEGQNVVFYLYGPYGSGKMSTVELVCRDLGIPVVIADMEKIVEGQYGFEDTLWLTGRETLLQQAALCLENLDCIFEDSGRGKKILNHLCELVEAFSRLTFLVGKRAWKLQGLFGNHVFIDHEFAIPDEETRENIWKIWTASGCYRLSSDVDFGLLAGKFLFTPGQIRDALVAARNLSHWQFTDANEINMDVLYSACRAQSNQKLSALARKVNPKYAWDDIVLPSDQLGQLREICNQAKYRHVVYGSWGFDRKLSLGKGLNALFSGSSGTGKTMAAEIISNDLELDLYKIDLSQVVSKYIGETEKNLDKIFTEAQTSNAILFFDEADALFGKRSEVKDAHDRYANIEIGYLLQKMEEYEGITILATNLRQNMDEAFLRRMQVIVEFPFPDEEYRRRIWEVVFPSEAPLDRDMDFGNLAREVKLPGGNIKNIAVAAAFYAAEDGGLIRMPHLMKAVRQEYRKLGRIWNESERNTKGKLVS